MEWKDISINPLLIKNYNLLNEIGIFEFIESIKIKNKELEDLLIESYNIFTKQSIDELLVYLVEHLSSRFIPSKLLIILNEGIMVNKLKIVSYTNLKQDSDHIVIDSLEPYNPFFTKFSGTTHYAILETEIENQELLEPFKSVSAELVIPINGHSGLYGLIIFGPKILGEAYSVKEMEYIDRLIKFLSIGIQNNLHYEHSVKDSKTGLYNHNFFVRRINEETARARRLKHPVSLIIMDIDHFKIFNDKYGHLAGDEVIISIANTLKHKLREMDVLSRFGGEEFTILLPETPRKMAEMVGERIRKSIENLHINYENEVLRVTISLGVSVFDWFEKIDANTFLTRADHALYISKENGRNMVTVYKKGLLNRALNIK
ncbi:MAG: GGDEF domain-containing protein [Spirochaetales bacterium]|nr:GGDEF domain-containing protein [Spirochaetales bacterium]